MQNEISAVYLKKEYLGNIYATGEASTRSIYLNGTRRQVRAYPVTSDKVSSFLVLAPVAKSEAHVELFQELSLKNERLMAISNSIGQGQNRNTYYEYVIFVDELNAKGEK